ncbi:MAG: B12-binding domain-containing radical SAM protein, partial [Nitrospinota bacterium]
MKITIIYPKWTKLKHQTEFHLPPHGPVCFAAAISDEVEISFCDENLEEIDFGETPDLVAMSVMLTCQIRRAWEISDQYRASGVPVIFGGIGTMLHYQETLPHADSVFLGEAEGHFRTVLNDFKREKLKKTYNFQHDYPDARLIGPARRSILNRPLYNYRGVQMVDLVHASRGCKFNCFPCCAPFLGGRNFRPREIDKVIKELEGINNNR